MLIGNRYSDNKLYRGIKHYDSLPLTSGDLHEYADILQMKNAFFMNNIIGSGTLNEPECIISSGGISLESPSVVLIDGDISLVKSTGNLVSSTDVSTAGYSAGLVCIVGWYQSLTANSTLRAYGGVNNDIIPNDILDQNLSIQVSTRYQLRWDKVIIDENRYKSGESITINIANRDETGSITSGNSTLSLPASTDNVRVASRPDSMSYAVSDLYVVPILRYDYISSTITEAKAFRAVRPLGTTRFITSTSTPTEGEYEDGTIWYNPDTYKFKFYVENVGFMPTASDMTLVQYNNTVNISNAITTPSDISVSIGISSYDPTDILQVLYNGVVLTKDINYTIDTDSITLLGATTEVGDSITFIDIKLIEAGAANTIVTEFNNHVISYGTSTIKGHVSLSDSANDSLGIESHTAATPKAVYAATTIRDSVTNKNYRLIMTNGVLGTVEV